MDDFTHQLSPRGTTSTRPPWAHEAPPGLQRDPHPPPVPTDLPAALQEFPQQVKIEFLIAIVDSEHPRLAQGIRLLWGYQACVNYLNQLIMYGAEDGTGRTRQGFTQDVMSALICLTDLHEITHH